MNHCVVFVTAPKGPTAKRLARLLLKKKLVACANIVGGMESLFWWKGRIDAARETLLIFKTERSRVKALIAAVKAAHPYEVCEVIVLPVIAGNPTYLAWIDASIGGKR